MEQKKLRLALVGLGGQGRGHAKMLMSAPADFPCELVAVCDIEPEKFGSAKIQSNIKENRSDLTFDGYPCYTDIDEMLSRESLDMVTLVVPTYLHCEFTVKCLKAGLHVLCEKPMALDVADCDLMLKTAKECGKKLMVGQCLRFWSEYEILKSIIETKELGDVVAGMFWRGSETPSGSYQDWYLHKSRGGGAILDQHIHDVDMVQYLFGMPTAVSTSGKVVHEDTYYDTLCTNYIYDNGPVIFSHNDWALSTPFAHGFRINFTGGTVEMSGEGLFVTKKGGTTEKVAFEHISALAKETRYFAETILGLHENEINCPESSRETIRLVRAEMASADKQGEKVYL